MKSCVFLSMTDMSDYECYDHLVIPHLAQLGWQVETLDWHDKSIDWNNFDYVIVRSTWDYQEHQQEFIEVLNTINNSNATLLNPLDVMTWNISKTYLKELEQQGVDIIPTIWCDNFDLAKAEQAFNQFDCQEIIIKPCISAGSFHTYRLTLSDLREQADQLAQVFNNIDFMVQPFIENILSAGEFSLFYFNGALSHSIVKQPKQGDFRVQEEFGGEISLIDASEELQNVAEQVLAKIDDKLLYVRADMVQHEGKYLLIELELIEPSLYFNLDEGSAKRFALAFDDFASQQ